MAKDKSAVSIWFWVFTILITALPCIGTLFAVIFAFVGSNESRKNYFKAVLFLQLVIVLGVFTLYTVGFGAIFLKILEDNGWKFPQWPK